jgi:hypothetical protein
MVKFLSQRAVQTRSSLLSRSLIVADCCEHDFQFAGLPSHTGALWIAASDKAGAFNFRRDIRSPGKARH